MNGTKTPRPLTKQTQPSAAPRAGFAARSLRFERRLGWVLWAGPQAATPCDVFAGDALAHSRCVRLFEEHGAAGFELAGVVPPVKRAAPASDEPETTTDQNSMLVVMKLMEKKNKTMVGKRVKAIKATTSRVRNCAPITLRLRS